MAYTTVLTKTVTLPVDGVIEVDGAVLLGFPSGAAQWGFGLYIDGALVWAPQGNNLQVSQHIGGIKACSAGPRVIELKWSAAPSVKLHSAYLKIKGFNNTAGV
jgi:hypothetical protein